MVGKWWKEFCNYPEKLLVLSLTKQMVRNSIRGWRRARCKWTVYMSRWLFSNGRNSSWSLWINYSPSNLHRLALSQSKWLVMKALISARATYFHPPTTNPLILPSLKCPVEFYCLIKTKTLHGFIISFLSAFPCLLSTVLIATIITLKYNWKKKRKRSEWKDGWTTAGITWLSVFRR